METSTLAAHDPRIAAVHREVLVPAFTPEELVDLDELLESVAAGTSTVSVAIDDGSIAGAAVVDGGPDDEVHLLGYLAARGDGRGRGVGSALMRHLLSHWSDPGGPALVLAEVHDPDRWATTESERPADRMRFYQRLGARRLPFEWVQPRLAPDLDLVRGMCLLVLHARPPALVGDDAVDGPLLRRWIARLHGDAEDPELAAVRAAAAGDRVTLLPLDGPSEP